MKVKELIKLLSELKNQEAEIRTYNGDKIREISTFNGIKNMHDSKKIKCYYLE